MISQHRLVVTTIESTTANESECRRLFDIVCKAIKLGRDIPGLEITVELKDWEANDAAVSGWKTRKIWMHPQIETSVSEPKK